MSAVNEQFLDLFTSALQIFSTFLLSTFRYRSIIIFSFSGLKPDSSGNVNNLNSNSLNQDTGLSYLLRFFS